MAKKFRILTLLLIFSGALNIGLLAAFAFMSVKDRNISFGIARADHGAREETTNGQLFASMSRCSFRELVSFLTNRELIEEGYTKRDLAVAALVSHHYFNIEKALSSKPSQVRTVTFAGGTTDVFPGLTEEQFEAIIRYAYQEKWPLTSKGLFAFLQKKQEARDESLEQAFLLTPEFYALQLFFRKTETPQEPETLLNLACEGSWELLESFAKEQAQVIDFSVDKRRALLLSYLAHHSPTAAQLLLRTDFVFALKRLEDRGILDMLSLLKRQSEEGTKFCVELLRSPRSDAIWQAAAMTLYAYVGELPPAPIDPQAVLSRFSSDAQPPKKVEPIASAPSAPAPAQSKFHVVKDGESLWKISRQHSVKVDEIIRLNGLENDSLFPGMMLKLPN